MKKIALIAFACIGFGVIAQEANTWRLGIQMGAIGSHPKFAGGMDQANARFHVNPFGSGYLDFSLRYDINAHWMLFGGMGLRGVGYNFAIADNYSLLHRSKQFSLLESSSLVLDMPVMAAYKFKLNCQNWRWIVGAGLNLSFASAGYTGSYADCPTEGTGIPPNSWFNTEVTYSGGTFMQSQWLVGREKLFKRGSIFSVSLVANHGWRSMADARVTYQIDGINYEHRFKNNGNYCGLRLAYFFRPLNKAALASVK